MANIKSQKKRIRTNERARLRNQAIKSALRTDIRSFREAAEAGDKDKATEALRAASRSLDKACLLYTSPSPRDSTSSRMPSSA